jgi:hypothetical protein
VLEFLGLKDEYSESEVEEALIRHLETFLVELGGDFTFVGRQRRLRVGDAWYRVDSCVSIWRGIVQRAGTFSSVLARDRLRPWAIPPSRYRAARSRRADRGTPQSP